MKLFTRRRLILMTLTLTCISLIYVYINIYPGDEYFIPRKEIVNKLDHAVFISPAECNGEEDLLILVLSVFQHDFKRQSIRDTWGRVARNDAWPKIPFNHSVKLVFLIGAYENTSVMQKLKTEAERHGDIMQIDCLESYQTPSKKILMAFKWMEERCPYVDYVLKTDDDVFVHLPMVMEKLKSEKGAYLFGDKLQFADSHRSGKHKLSYDEYPFFFFPPYLIGYAYFMPSSVARRLLKASYHVPYLKFEDVYITGLLAKATHTELVQIYPSWLKSGKLVKKCDFADNNLIAAADLDTETIFNIWDTLIDTSICF